MDNYHPDLLYTDGGVPFGNEVGRSMIAHLYNSNAARHGGKAEVVYNCKQQSDGRWVQDLERGIMPKIDPYPWQTDTSIGDWFYDRNYKYRPVSWVIHMLVDNVSKNGNLLMNIVQRPDGSLDAEVEQMLEQLADWNAINGEAIYGTRPWLVYGEGAGPGRRAGLQRGLQLHGQGHPLHHQGHRRSMPSPWAGRPTASWSIRSLAKPAGERQQHHRRQPAGLRRQSPVAADRRRPGGNHAGEEGLRVHLPP